MQTDYLEAQSLKLARSMRVPAFALPILCLFVIAWYFYFLSVWVQNIPFHDDILDVVNFLTQLSDAESPWERIRAFFVPHVEHRTTSSRLIYYLIYLVQGEIDFVTLTYVANFGVLLLAVLLIRLWPHPGNQHLIALVVCLLLFQPRAYGPMFWVMCGFAFFYVNVYGLAAIALLERSDPMSIGGALICAVLATYTLASGQLVWLLGLAVILHRRKCSTSFTWKLPIVWITAALLCIASFHYGKQSPNSLQGLADLLWQGSTFPLHFFLAVMGSGFAYGSSVTAELVGAFLLLALCWLTTLHYRSGLSSYHFLAWFMVAQCLTIALGRAAYAGAVEGGLVFAIDSRYSYHSLVLTTSVLLTALSGMSVRSRIPILAALFVSALVCSFGYYFYQSEVEAHWRKRIELYNSGLYRLIFMPPKKSNAIVERAVELRLYIPPERPLALSR